MRAIAEAHRGKALCTTNGIGTITFSIVLRPQRRRREPYARVRSISTETVRSGKPTGAQGFSSLTRTPYALG